VNLHDLDKSQLINILTQVRGNFIRQYQWLFEEDGVELKFDAESLDLIAERTLKTELVHEACTANLNGCCCRTCLICHAIDANILASHNQ
jgi:ATP-dependent protease Clp ATPase subunit